MLLLNKGGQMGSGMRVQGPLAYTWPPVADWDTPAAMGNCICQP